MSSSSSLPGDPAKGGCCSPPASCIHNGLCYSTTTARKGKALWACRRRPIDAGQRICSLSLSHLSGVWLAFQVLSKWQNDLPRQGGQCDSSVRIGAESRWFPFGLHWARICRDRNSMERNGREQQQKQQRQQQHNNNSRGLRHYGACIDGASCLASRLASCPASEPPRQAALPAVAI